MKKLLLTALLLTSTAQAQTDFLEVCRPDWQDYAAWHKCTTDQMTPKVILPDDVHTAVDFYLYVDSLHPRETIEVPVKELYQSEVKRVWTEACVQCLKTARNRKRQCGGC